MRTNAKGWLLVAVGLLATIGFLGGVKAAQIGKMVAGKSFTPPPETISSAKVQEAEWKSVRAAVGTLVAVHGVTLGAELPGVVRKVAFDSGATVRRGDLLVKLDTSMEEAQLAAAQADASLAKVNLERAQNLREGGANAPADLDAARARARAAEASVASLEAAIAKKTIRAPFDGRISIRQVELGQVVSPGTPVATLQSVTPIHVDFWLPQQALPDLEKGQKVEVRTDTYPDQRWEGEVVAVNPEVDVATRNVKVRAIVPNPGGRLRPGMFVGVEVVSAGERRVLVVPATAVVFAPYGDSVFAIVKNEGGSGMVAEQKFVRLGERRGDFVEVVSGLTAGETIVGSGAFKLRNGMAVAVNDALAPKPEIDPKPTDR